MMGKFVLAVFFGIFLASALPSSFAEIIVYTDKATFLSDTGSTSATGPLPNLGTIPGGAAASQMVGDVTFTITPPSSELIIASDFTALNPGPDIAISNIENLNADLSSPVFALGFDVVEPTDETCDVVPCVDTTFSVTLKNGPTTVDSFEFNAPDDVLAFVGVSSDEVFDRVEIRDITATIDDEFFGEFYTNTSPPGLQEQIDVLAFVLGALIDGLGNTFTTIGLALTSLQGQADDHETRITDIENIPTLITRTVSVDVTTQFLVVNDLDVTRQSVVWFSIDPSEPGDVQSCGAPLVQDGSFQINCAITSLDAGSTINYVVLNPDN